VKRVKINLGETGMRGGGFEKASYLGMAGPKNVTIGGRGERKKA